MIPVSHRGEAEQLAHQALNGDDYGYGEPYRLRLAAIGQLHATLAVAQAITELTVVIADRLSPRP